MSETIPFQCGWRVRERSSARMPSTERETIRRPSCSVIEQKLQPPPQPRCTVTENRFIRRAGVKASPPGWSRVKGSA
jgi:hypothetical protein